MSDWKQRLKRDLEPVLREADPRPRISAYHNMPYAIFHYPPDEELPLRGELAMLRTRLEQAGKRVTTISLADCLADALSAEGLTTKRIEQAEQRTGAEKMIDTIHQVISRRRPLDDLVAARLPEGADPHRTMRHVSRS